jgi:hypothetical protein
MREPREHPQSQKLKQLVVSAVAGDASAQDKVGQLFQYGVEVTADFAEAAYWYDLAANQNYTPALRHLAWLYENGLGVGSDIEGAEELLQRAARLGDAESAYSLGRYLSAGPETIRDLEGALKWLQEAEDAGHLEAKEARKELASRINASNSLPTEAFTITTPSLDKIAKGGEWRIAKSFVNDGSYVVKGDPLAGYVYKLNDQLVMYGFILATSPGMIENVCSVPQTSFYPGQELFQLREDDGDLKAVSLPSSFGDKYSYEVGSIQVGEGDFVRPGQPALTLKSEIRSQDSALRNFMDPPIEKAGQVSKLFVKDGTILEQNEAIMTVEFLSTVEFIDDPFEYLLTAFSEMADAAPDLLNFVSLHFGWTEEETSIAFECLSHCATFPKDKLLRLRSALLGKWTHQSRKKAYRGGPQDIKLQAMCTLSRNGYFSLSMTTVTKTDTSFEQRRNRSQAGQKFSQTQQIAAMGGSSSFAHEISQMGSNWERNADEARARAQPQYEGTAVEGTWFLNGPNDIVVIRGQGAPIVKYQVILHGAKLRIDGDLYEPSVAS